MARPRPTEVKALVEDGVPVAPLPPEPPEEDRGQLSLPGPPLTVRGGSFPLGR